MIILQPTKRTHRARPHDAFPKFDTIPPMSPIPAVRGDRPAHCRHHPGAPCLYYMSMMCELEDRIETEGSTGPEAIMLPSHRDLVVFLVIAGPSAGRQSLSLFVWLHLASKHLVHKPGTSCLALGTSGGRASTRRLTNCLIDR